MELLFDTDVSGSFGINTDISVPFILAIVDLSPNMSCAFLFSTSTDGITILAILSATTEFPFTFTSSIDSVCNSTDILYSVLSPTVSVSILTLSPGIIEYVFG